VTAQLGKDAFQCVDIARISESVCKATWCVTDAAKGVEILKTAFRIAREGKRSGPDRHPARHPVTDIDFDPETYCPKHSPYPPPIPRTSARRST
jgi:tartronate-semialdehyde synthase